MLIAGHKKIYIIQAEQGLAELRVVLPSRCERKDLIYSALNLGEILGKNSMFPPVRDRVAPHHRQNINDI